MRDIKVFEEAKIRDIIKRVATGTTTVEDAYELEKVLTALNELEKVYNKTVCQRSLQ